ncbi:MAG TPA: hypothetical protein VLT51_09635 [Anaerolineales bacterium]|nr:hypothetical protein [Anaerolineales bacterium]
MWHTNPYYLAGNDAAYTGDVAVSILDETPPGIPSPGFPQLDYWIS